MTATMTRTLQGKRLAVEIHLKSEQNGRWYMVGLTGQALRGEPLVSLSVDDVWLGASARRFIPLRFWGRVFAQVLLVCVPAKEQRVVAEVYGAHVGQSLRVWLVNVPQAVAALLLICLRPSVVLPIGAGKRMRGNTTLRRRLAIAAIKLGPRISYPAWLRRYDDWAPAWASKSSAGSVMALVFRNGAQDEAALEATLAALKLASGDSSGAGVDVAVIDGTAGNAGVVLREALDKASAEFFVVLHAGEVIAPHAIGALVRFAGIKRLAIAYADEDQVDFAGNRSLPIFKPEPSRMLMLSGALATGIFLIRRDALAAPGEGAARCADALRQDAWLRQDGLAMAGGNAAFSARLPLILTHRRLDTQAAPPEVLAGIAQAHLGSDWVGEIDARELPLRIRPGIVAGAPKVSLIVASTGRLGHVRSCLSAILEQTDYPDFEMVIVLSQSVPLDATQQDILAPIIADARVRVVFAPMQRFNYSRANNVAVKDSTAPLICLLNDDVAPIARDWLSIMVGHLQDPRIAAVGAKLYYPEETIQHGGVIIGLGGLCDHSFRFLPRGQAGYAGRAGVEQELSAVTAACMLIRKSVFEAVGGLDENFPSAYNDVDLCLKIRGAGHGIIWSAQAELWHHETISFVKHYADEHKLLAETDIGIMRERWAAECAVDPFHNPNLSLEMESEWELAFPPRLGDLPEVLGLVRG